MASLSISTFSRFIRFQFNPTQKKRVLTCTGHWFSMFYGIALAFIVSRAVASRFLSSRSSGALFALWNRTFHRRPLTQCVYSYSPIFISLIYLVCTNFPGIGRNQKERKNIHRLHASMAWRGNWHSWIHARGIM